MQTKNSLLRGSCILTYPTRLPAEAIEQICFGRFFMDRERRIHLELCLSRREGSFDRLWRNPLKVFLGVIHPRFRKNLFLRLRRMSRQDDQTTFIAGLSFSIHRSRGTLRIMEAARLQGDPRSSQAIRQLMHFEIIQFAERMGLQQIICETFSRYGEDLQRNGWVPGREGHPWWICMAAFLHRYQCYGFRLTEKLALEPVSTPQPLAKDKFGPSPFPNL